MYESNVQFRLSIRNAICQMINEMNPLENNRLPSERTLATQLNVSRATIRSVLADLAAEGRIIRRQGNGTFINLAAYKSKAALYPMEYYWNIIQSYGYTPRIQVIDLQLVDGYPNMRTALHVKEDKLVLLRRVYLANDNPCIYCLDIFPYYLIEGRNFDSSRQCSIFQLLYEACGLTILWADVKIRAMDTSEEPTVDQVINQMKRTPNPILKFQNTCYDKKDHPVLYTESFFKTDIIEFSYIQQYGIGRTIDT